APDPADAADRLRVLVTAAQAFTIVHCCARRVPLRIIRRAGAGAAGFDVRQLGPEDEDALAETVEAGLGILAGVVPAMPPATGSAQDEERAGPQQPPSAREAAERVSVLWRRLGWPAGPGSSGPAGTSEQVVLTPACGLAGASPGYARAALERCREAARLLPELIEEGTG
ncbi:MAG: hypothetical protein J2P32_13450, partial [Actinobacteria bacterium]|nr:hypothetical protein [Actinomycetota bacterium]